MQARPHVEIVHGNVVSFRADALALKFAQGLYGADGDVADKLGLSESTLLSQLSAVGSHHLADGGNRVAAAQVLFIAVLPLNRFRYAQIREFAERVLSALKDSAPQIRHLAVTLHGPNYGLDEMEAFSAELAGFLDGCARGDAPPALERITFVELNAKRAQRLTSALPGLLPGQAGKAQAQPGPVVPEPAARPIATAGKDSEAKPHIFVAMPFTEEFDDIYYYGIEPVVKSAGYLCERADTRSFSGDILDWIKRRIETAALVVADLSTANANVYLEVGYAWGHRRPTILLTRDVNDLKFDVRSQRCLVYKRIRDLEQNLRRELGEVTAQGRS